MLVLEQALNFAALLPQSAVAGKTPQFLEAPGENEGIMTPGKVNMLLPAVIFTNLAISSTAQ